MRKPNLLTDLTIRQLPAANQSVGGLYGANTIVTDPTFNTKIVRLTDAASGSGNFSSMQSAGDPSGYSIWNTDDTLIVTHNSGGVFYLFQFDPATMQGAQLGGKNPVFPYKLNGSVCTSKVNPGVLYNCPNNSTVINALTFVLVEGVWTYQDTTQLCDFSNILPGGTAFKATWTGSFTCSLGDEVFSLGFSDAGPQGTGVYQCLYKVGSGYRMLNTNTLAVTGEWGQKGKATMSNFPAGVTSFTLHDSNATPNPAYTALSWTGGVGAIVWKNAALSLICDSFSGHHGLGFVALYPGGAGGGQYDQILYATPTVRTPIIPKQAGPPGLPADQTPAQSYTGDQHSANGPINRKDQTINWITNGIPNVFPFSSCWMGEVRGLDLTGLISGKQGTVYRVCHTFNSGLSTEYITCNAMCIPSQTGNFLAFNSDWSASPGGTSTVGILGSTSGAATGTLGVDARGDIFIVQVPYVA